MAAEGAVAVWGRRYVDFMAEQGLMDFGKYLLRKLNIRSQRVFTAIRLAELVWGLVLLKRARA